MKTPYKKEPSGFLTVKTTEKVDSEIKSFQLLQTRLELNFQSMKKNCNVALFCLLTSFFQRDNQLKLSELKVPIRTFVSYLHPADSGQQHS